MNIRQWFVCLMTALFSITALAQYVGPNKAVITTVADALKAADDTPVVLEGYITSQIRRKHYEFKDATGTITLEIDKEVLWPAQITAQNKVRIYGEVDKERWGTRTDIDVDRIEVVGPSAK